MCGGGPIRNSEDQKIPRSIGFLSKLASLSASNTFFYGIDLRIIQNVEDNRRGELPYNQRRRPDEQLKLLKHSKECVEVLRLKS